MSKENVHCEAATVEASLFDLRGGLSLGHDVRTDSNCKNTTLKEVSFSAAASRIAYTEVTPMLGHYLEIRQKVSHISARSSIFIAPRWFTLRMPERLSLWLQPVPAERPQSPSALQCLTLQKRSLPHGFLLRKEPPI